MSKVTPIRPEEVGTARTEQIPDFVIEAFNELIIEKFYQGGATLSLSEVENRIMAKAAPAVQLNRNWLNVEPIYERSGWKVIYDKPGYNEHYKPTYKFIPKY